MQVFFLNTIQTILLDVFAWLIIHLTIGYCCSKIPLDWLNPEQIIPGFFLFLWNSLTLGWIYVAYAFLNNLVPIILQRYNRPRMRKLLAQLEKKSIKKGIPYAPQKELSHSY